MFSDEYKFDLDSYIRDWIRLDANYQQKLKDGNNNAYNFIKYHLIQAILTKIY